MEWLRASREALNMKRYLVSVYICLSVLLCKFVEVTQADYKLDLQLERYSNPKHLQADGSCCHKPHFSPHCTDCSNRFIFCILPFGTALKGSSIFDSYICGSKPSYVTGVVESSTGHPDSMSFARESFIDRQNNITNPISFTGNGSWPGNFQLVVKIKNWRSIFDEYLVDLIVENWELAVDRVESRSLTGLKGIATLAVSAQVTCINGKLCRNCTETCDPAPEEGSPVVSTTQEEGTPATPKADSPQPLSGSSPLVGVSPLTMATSTITGGDDGSGLIIGLSVAGGVIVLILLVLLVVVFICLMGRKIRKSRNSELSPFSRPTTGNIYQSTATAMDEEESGTSTSHRYQRIPTEDYDHPHEWPQGTGASHYPDFARVGQTPGLRGSGGQVQGGRGNVSSQYSVITHQNLGFSSAHSLGDISEASEEEEMGGAARVAATVESGYNVIRRENMDGYISEDQSEEEVGGGGSSAGEEQDRLRDRLPTPQD